LLGQFGVGLVFGRDPHLASLLDDLLTDVVHTLVQSGDGPAAGGTFGGPGGQLGEQRVESLHGDPWSHTPARAPHADTRPTAGRRPARAHERGPPPRRRGWEDGPRSPPGKGGS